MIYHSLRTLPYLTALDIIRTGNIQLLSDEPADAETLLTLWEPMLEKFQKLFNSSGQSKVFNAAREIEFLGNKYEIIVTACKSLEFSKSDELIQMLHDYGYRFRIDQYHADIKQTLREVKGISAKISQLQEMLPKQSQESNDDDLPIIEQMAAYSAILGFDFDFNIVSCLKFKSLEHQVKTKIKQLEKQTSKNKH